MSEPPPVRNAASLPVAVICGGLLAGFCVLSLLAVRTKSPTVDEPLHLVGAYAHVFERDYRINPEDPPLWNYLAMLPHSRESLQLDTRHPVWPAMLGNTDHQAVFATQTLFQSRNDGVGLIQASRMAMPLLALALGAMLSRWSWQLAGPSAALAATALFCLDPNFLGHAPLVKNDVAMSLFLFALAWAMWSVGLQAGPGNVALLGLALGAAMATKFSGLLLAPVIALALLARALRSEPWPTIADRVERSAAGRLLVAASICAVTFLLAWLVVWAAYGFRYEPTPLPNVHLPFDMQVRAAAKNQLLLESPLIEPTAEQIDSHRPSVIVSGILWARDNQVAPEAWLYGLLFTYQSSLLRTCYLLGEHGVTGWWYYFPLAMLFKTPVATITAVFLAAIVLLVRPRAGGVQGWTWICLAIPLVVYGGSAMSSNLNLGIRHVLPLYPIIYLIAGIAAAKAVAMLPRLAVAGALAVVGVAVEVLLAYPNYIAFFNAPSWKHRLGLLSDSNLDWGQDLAALGGWRQEHPSERLYFACFGAVDPAVYGIRDYVNLPGGFWLGPPPGQLDPSRPGALAISAGVLQGNNVPADLKQLYAPLRTQRPREVLGGTIYLFDYPAPP